MKSMKLIILALTLVIGGANISSAEPDTYTWDLSAKKLYDTGFMYMLKQSDDLSVTLFDSDVIENDSKGAGVSEKGINTDIIWGENHGKKILSIDDPRAEKAFFFVYSQRQGKYPLTFTINGNESRIENWKQKGYERFRWSEFPVDWLKKGKNIIEFSSPEATSPDEGWVIWLARADEFEAGGGDPTQVGETSLKSVNGGKSWKKHIFGNEKQTSIKIDGFNIAKNKAAEKPFGDRAEYSVRISMKRYVKSGWLESPVIDLWQENPDDFICRMRTIQKLSLTIDSDQVEGSALKYLLRTGTSPSPFSSEWTDYSLIETGDSSTASFSGADINSRYIQIRFEFSAINPLKSPKLHGIRISAEFEETFPVPLHKNLYVTDINNTRVKYSSVGWEWEKSDRPEFEELKKRENLDQLIAGSRSSFEAQMKLLDHVTKRFRWTSPLPEYPEWNALANLNRIDKAGGGGMCIQFNNILAGMCMAYGWQARLLNIDGHEVCEVWNDDYGKWIYIDASNVNHCQCDIETGEPMSFLEIHNAYMDYFYPDRVMDWLNDYRFSAGIIFGRDDKPPIVRSSLTYHDNDSVRYTGFVQSRFVRMIPRTNWFEKPYPRPLSHGNGSHWPWNDYINWYDERTPPRLQYRWHTDRPRDMWPELNTVHIHAAQGYGNDSIFLHFESYTPNFCHYEVNCDDSGWKDADERYAWLLGPGKNNIEVRAVNKQGVTGKTSSVAINRVVVPMKEWEQGIYPE